MAGHHLRGVFELPHGSGKKAIVAALTTNETLAVSALQAGAKYAGDIGDSIGRRVIEPPMFKRVVVTTEMEDACCKKGNPLSGLLKKHKMIPCEQDRTIVEPDEFVEVVKKHVNGTYVKFSTSSCGNIAVTVGKVDIHTSKQLAENLDSILRHLYAVQPKDFGTGPRGKRKYDGKYVIDVHLNVVGAGSYPLDLVELLCEVDKTGRYK
jgi:ribosomal protein L1